MSGTVLPLLVPAPHWVPFFIQGSHPDSLGRQIPLQIKLFIGTWWDLLLVVQGGCTPVTKEVITHHLSNSG
jgi:hypothetical protein